MTARVAGTPSRRRADRPKFDVGRAAVLYRQGLTCQQIADRYGLTRSYVGSRLRQAGTPMRPPGRPVDEHHLDPDVLVRLRQVGASWDELAAIFGLTRYAVRGCYVLATATRGPQGA